MSSSDFNMVVHRLGLIGTVIIDVPSSEISQPKRLAKIIEILEQNSIGVILLSENPYPVELEQVFEDEQNLSDNGKLDSVDLDELWVRISVNLAYRKQSPGMVVKPGMPPKEAITTHSNRLADQLNATEALVDNLSEQLRLAGMVQRDFLPRQLPNTERFIWSTAFCPAEWVSGDIYDIARLDENHIGFYIADAVGHSMPAALLTIFIKQALVMRQTLGNDYQILPPAEVVRSLNLKMAEQKLSGYQFATCCYCLLNTETLELVYARAGHPYPILIRDGKCTQLEIRGSLLGIFEQALYKQQSVQLQRGDRLILYSDGADPFVGAFHDTKGFIFTDEFLELTTLPLNQMFEGLNELAQKQQSDPSEIDDITIVGLDIK
jgi:sigma-B regulation protein RsbU (phosphoserine phosphatase)